MGDEKNSAPFPDSFRALIRDVSDKLDDRAQALREQTNLRKVRPSDAKVAALIALRPRGLPEIAEKMGISRQAAHRALQRLLALGAISYEHAPGSKREKIAALTPLGGEAQKAVASVVQQIELDVENALGPQEAAAFKASLRKLAKSL